jgi:hypothetical protein
MLHLIDHPLFIAIKECSQPEDVSPVVLFGNA